MDRGMVSEENVEYLHQGGRRYIVGTAKSRLRKFEREFLSKEWTEIHVLFFFIRNIFDTPHRMTKRFRHLETERFLRLGMQGRNRRFRTVARRAPIMRPNSKAFKQTHGIPACGQS